MAARETLDQLLEQKKMLEDRIEEYRSMNECYVIEDYDACCLVEGIKVPKADGSGWE